MSIYLLLLRCYTKISNKSNWLMDFLCCPREIRQKKTAEQAEDSSPNPSSSACDIRIQKQISRSFGKSFPPSKIVLPKLRPYLSPTHCPNTWRAEPQKEKCPFHFRKNPPPRKSKEQGTFFLFGVAE